jgi:hypothetical protein
VPAASRALKDDQPRLQAVAMQRRLGDISPEVAGVVDWMLCLKPQDRPQSAQAVREVLDGRADVPALPDAPAATADLAMPVRRTDIDPTQPSSADANSATVVTSGNAGVTARGDALAPTMVGTGGPPMGASTGFEDALEGAARPPQRRLARMLIALVAINAAAWWWFTREPAAPPALAESQAAIAAPQTSVAPTPVQPAPVPAAASALAPAVRQERETVESVLPGRTAEQGQEATPPPRPSPSPVTRPAPSQTQDTRPAEPPRTAAPTSATPSATPTGPRERCGERVFLAMALCIKRECDRDASLRRHPECVRMREIEEARRNPNYY